MAGNFLNMETELPVFTEQESEKEMIEEIVNYLKQLTDKLAYTLMNLDETNFNRKALDDLSAGSAGSIAEKVQALARAVQVAGNGDITIGSNSVRVNINGSTVSINGVPQ